MLDFKSLVMAEAANLMETYTTPATTAEELAERRMNIYIICLPAYPEWDHDSNFISAPAQHDAVRKDNTVRNDNTAFHIAPNSIDVVPGDVDAHLDRTAAPPQPTTTQPHAIKATSKASPDHNCIVAAMPNDRILSAPAADILNTPCGGKTAMVPLSVNREFGEQRCGTVVKVRNPLTSGPQHDCVLLQGTASSGPVIESIMITNDQGSFRTRQQPCSTQVPYAPRLGVERQVVPGGSLAAAASAAVASAAAPPSSWRPRWRSRTRLAPSRAPHYPDPLAKEMLNIMD